MIISRRDMLALIPAAATCGLAGLERPAFATDRKDTFLFLSLLLTGHQHLDADVAASLLEALRKAHGDFDERLDKLSEILGNNTDFAELPTASALRDPVNKETTHEIVRAWYLGRVGTNSANGGTVAYDRALMFQPTKGIVAVPGFPLGGPNYWVDDPAE
jgi:fructose 5-dehydrogenase small subunit